MENCRRTGGSFVHDIGGDIPDGVAEGGVRIDGFLDLPDGVEDGGVVPVQRAADLLQGGVVSFRIR